MLTLETILYKGKDEKAVALICNLLKNNMDYFTPMIINDEEQFVHEKAVDIIEVLDAVVNGEHVISVKYEYDYKPSDVGGMN